MLEFDTKSKFTTTEMEKDYMPVEMETGHKVLRPINTGRIKQTIKHVDHYVIPNDKLQWLLHSATDKYYINILGWEKNIEIDKETYERLIKEI